MSRGIVLMSSPCLGSEGILDTGDPQLLQEGGCRESPDRVLQCPGEYDDGAGDGAAPLRHIAVFTASLRPL